MLAIRSWCSGKNFLVRGFTLIELLVVISIIGMLSSVVLSSLNTGRQKARQAVRLQDLRNIHTALQSYYAQNGVYPGSCGWNGYYSAYSGTVGTTVQLLGSTYAVECRLAKGQLILVLT